MSFWDRLRKIFGQEPSKKQSKTLEKPQPERVPVIDQPDITLPDPGDMPVDLFQLIFNNKDKHTTKMLNSISLSSDMKTLYLIDNGRAIPFDLTVPEGVLVGLLGGQLVVATAAAPAVSLEEEPTLGGEKMLAAAGEKHTFKVGPNSQYTLSFNDKNGVLGIIGADDITSNLQGADTGGCVSKVLPLSKDRIVRIKRLEAELEVSEVS